jgi:hypothetical protein
MKNDAALGRVVLVPCECLHMVLAAWLAAQLSGSWHQENACTQL